MLAVVVLVALVVDPAAVAAIVAYGVAGVVLLAQLLVVRPRLTRRSDAVLAGGDAPRSHAHHAYIALELIKVIALGACGVLLLSA